MKTILHNNKTSSFHLKLTTPEKELFEKIEKNCGEESSDFEK